jgi:hypothetical protein
VFSPASSLTGAVELPVIKPTRAAIMPFIKNTKQVLCLTNQTSLLTHNVLSGKVLVGTC